MSAPGEPSSRALPGDVAAFIIAATAIGRDLDMIGGAESAELIAAGLLSVLLLPLAGSLLLRGDVKQNGGPADRAPKQVLLVLKEET